ncbi:hypothetical protein ACO22_03766 [Paracoccidioides brasiliensis]|uniref:Uncharacterized protein n=1 Tax=Paracoccidioides brasiliensis TaxID=121759 RepID=A0A1D2JF28_PARBR|nr:hypothetical protein ACO22_03766 [Paracoccidioides brasiliensis]ODH47774.1 hypothetical protein GX48_06110 [Paracoccidioides brasiliensis]
MSTLVVPSVFWHSSEGSSTQIVSSSSSRFFRRVLLQGKDILKPVPALRQEKWITDPQRPQFASPDRHG